MELSEAEVREFSDWLQAYLDGALNRQIEVDEERSWRLDQLQQREEADIAPPER